MAAGGTASYLLPIITILIHVLFPPFLIVLGITILLASFGKSLGIRKLYVRALIRIFDVSGNFDIFSVLLRVILAKTIRDLMKY